MKPVRLSLCMIVKDEEKALPSCLGSVKDVVDEIIVVDTGSRDKTPQIAEAHGARVFRHRWKNHFSQARNVALGLATGRWVLHLDADEELVQEDRANLEQLLDDSPASAFYLSIIDAFDPAMVFPVVRLWRNNPHYRYRGRIHERIDFGAATNKPGFLASAHVRVLHKGYTETDRTLKRHRDIALLGEELKAHPEDPLCQDS